MCPQCGAFLIFDIHSDTLPLPLETFEELPDRVRDRMVRKRDAIRAQWGNA